MCKLKAFLRGFLEAGISGCICTLVFGCIEQHFDSWYTGTEIIFAAVCLGIGGGIIVGIFAAIAECL